MVILYLKINNSIGMKFLSFIESSFLKEFIRQNRTEIIYDKKYGFMYFWPEYREEEECWSDEMKEKTLKLFPKAEIKTVNGKIQIYTNIKKG